MIPVRREAVETSSNGSSRHTVAVWLTADGRNVTGASGVDFYVYATDPEFDKIEEGQVLVGRYDAVLSMYLPDLHLLSHRNWL